MEEIIEMPQYLNVNGTTFLFLSELQNTIIDSNSTRIILDFRDCLFSHSLFTSFLGALSHIGNIFGKTVIYRSKKDSRLYSYFKHSGLYNYITEDTTIYTNQNAIPFRRIDMDDDEIISYIDNILDLAPIKLTNQCHELLFKNIYEIFNNSAEHSRQVHGVYGCGHWMPTKKQLVFSVYDTGIGIPALIKEQINSSYSSVEAIKWALKRGNSTKQLRQGIPRGLGLSDLFDFIKLNNGALNIFTNDLYYRYNNGGESISHLSSPIIGTLIGITIIDDYEHIYTTK
jgi:Histidine kinase-, DNA gyrase B-, and HSP90-like ATPase.